MVCEAKNKDVITKLGNPKSFKSALKNCTCNDMDSIVRFLKRALRNKNKLPQKCKSQFEKFEIYLKKFVKSSDKTLEWRKKYLNQLGGVGGGTGRALGK